MKSKIHNLNVDKLVPVPVDLSKLNDVAKNGVVKKDVYNARIENIEDKVSDIANIAIKTTLTLKQMRLKEKYLVLLT